MQDAISQILPPGDRALLWKPKQLDGISVLKACFHRFSYKKHSHQEFAIGVIEQGVQTFHHLGSRYVAPPTTIITVNPDEVHDGMSATKKGYRYRMIYIGMDKMEGMIDKPTKELRQIVQGSGLRHLWQTFMTGNYYYCFKCQSHCPATRLPKG